AYPTLHEGPETFDCLDVHVPTHVDALGVANALVLELFPAQFLIALVLVGVDGRGWEHLLHDVGHEGSAPDGFGRLDRDSAVLAIGPALREPNDPDHSLPRSRSAGESLAPVGI